MKKSNRGIFLLVAAAYIAYLGYKLIKDNVAPDANTEPSENPALFIAIGAAFLVGAAIIIVRALKDMSAARKEEAEEEAREAEEEAKRQQEERQRKIDAGEIREDEIIPDSETSIADRIRFFSSADDVEETESNAAEGDTEEAETTEADVAETDNSETEE